jgi:DtxR family Mn-dependent transcriptional regulator
MVPMGKLASAMSVTPGTATSMGKTLADLGLADYEPRTGVRLSPMGEKLALKMLRRHRLIERLLVDLLGLDWSEVHEEAEQLEHAISDKVLERIDALLGHPTADPHGDPIPTAKGQLAHSQCTNLMECPMDTPQRIARVVDQDPLFLQFAHRHGLTPGAIVTVTARDAIADAATLTSDQDRAPFTLGASAAQKIMVEEV